MEPPVFDKSIYKWGTQFIGELGASLASLSFCPPLLSHSGGELLFLSQDECTTRQPQARVHAPQAVQHSQQDSQQDNQQRYGGAGLTLEHVLIANADACIEPDFAADTVDENGERVGVVYMDENGEPYTVDENGERVGVVCMDENGEPYTVDENGELTHAVHKDEDSGPFANENGEPYMVKEVRVYFDDDAARDAIMDGAYDGVAGLFMDEDGEPYVVKEVRVYFDDDAALDADMSADDEVGEPPPSDDG